MIVDKIKYTANYNKGFYVRLILFQYYKKWYVRALTIGGIFSFLLCISFLLSWNPIGFHTFPYFAAFYSLFVAALPLYLYNKTRTNIQNNVLFNQEIQFEIDNNSIKINFDQQEKTILWNQVFKVENHSEAWLIFGTQESFFYLPKDKLKNDEQEQLMQWVINSSKFSH